MLNRFLLASLGVALVLVPGSAYSAPLAGAPNDNITLGAMVCRGPEEITAIAQELEDKDSFTNMVTSLTEANICSIYPGTVVLKKALFDHTFATFIGKDVEVWQVEATIKMPDGHVPTGFAIVFTSK